MTTDVIRDFRKKKTVPAPELMTGWCLLREELVDTRLESGLYMPSGGESAMAGTAEQQQEPIKRYRVVAVAKQYQINATTLADTPFGPGDIVAVVPTAKAIKERRLAVAIPEGCVVAWIADVGAWQPCPMDASRETPEPKS